MQVFMAQWTQQLVFAVCHSQEYVIMKLKTRLNINEGKQYTFFTP